MALAENETRSTADPSSRYWWSRLGLDIGVLLSIGGLICYSFARMAIDAYLSRFHLTVADIGIGYSDLIPPVVLIATAMIVLLAVLRLSYQSINGGRRKVITIRIRRIRLLLPRTLVGLLLGVVGAVVAIIALGLLAVGSAYLGDRTGWAPLKFVLTTLLPWTIAVIAVLFIIGSFATALDESLESVRPALEEFDNGSYADLPRSSEDRSRSALAWMLLGVAMWATLLFAAHLLGERSAEDAAKGDPVELSLAGIAFPGLEAHPGKVRAASSSGVALSPDGSCLVRLGQSGQFAIFFDPAADVTIRLPSLAIRVDDLPDELGCPVPTHPTD